MDPATRTEAVRRAALLASLLVAGCSGSFTFARGVAYKETPKENYLEGMEELKDDNHDEAISYFTYVKNTFPFSGYATLAELRLADTYYAQEKYTDAIDAYKQFEKFHPNHPEVTGGYAAFRACQGYVKQISSDWFLVPPSHEKDQSAVSDALQSLKAFMQQFPKSKYLPRARELHRSCIRRIADHELYVARFYLERDKPRAVILRLEGVLRTYPDAGLDPEVMLLLGQTYLSMQEQHKAMATFRDMVRRYPDAPHSAKARLYLEHLASLPAARAPVKAPGQPASSQPSGKGPASL